MAMTAAKMERYITVLFALFIKYVLFPEKDEGKRREMAYNVLKNVLLSPAESAQLSALANAYLTGTEVQKSAVNEFFSHPKVNEIMGKVEAFLSSPEAVAYVNGARPADGTDLDAFEERFLKMLGIFKTAKTALAGGSIGGAASSGLAKDDVEEMIREALEELREEIRREITDEVSKKIKTAKPAASGNQAALDDLGKQFKTLEEKTTRVIGKLEAQVKELEKQLEAANTRMDTGGL